MLGLYNRGVLLAGIAARKGLTVSLLASRREIAPQRLEKAKSAPGNGMASAAVDPQYLVEGRAATVVPKNSRPLSPEGQGDERRARRERLGGATASRRFFGLDCWTAR